MEKKTTKRIIIADDHAVVRTGLQMILDATSDLCICDEASHGQELIDKLRNRHFDLVILDISMPGKDAFDVLREIRSAWNKLPVVIFTMNSDEFFAVRMIRNGASAYINKETNPNQIIEILRTVLSGKKHISSAQAEILANIVTGTEVKNQVRHELLTDREFQIMFMLASGIKKSVIAEKLSVSKYTIGNHRNNILKKMNLSTNSDLTRYAIRQGIIK